MALCTFHTGLLVINGTEHTLLSLSWPVLAQKGLMALLCIAGWLGAPAT